MWARALALTATALSSAGCMPSVDLASYSSGADGDGAGETPGLGDETAGTGGGAAEPSPEGTAGAAGSEGGVAPGGLQGETGESSGNGGATGSVGPEMDPNEPEPEDPMVPPEVPQFRFVRLIADSDVTAGPLTSVAELNVLDADGEPIDRAGWTVAADSEELVYVGGAQAAFAVDGAPATMWHTPWFEVEPPPHPHFLEVDMGQTHSVGGFRYLARQDGSVDGSIAAYRFFVSVDGVEWGEPVASGTFPSSALEQEIRLAP